MTVPGWQAPVSGQVPRAAHITQFLGTHQITLVWAGDLQASEETAGSGSVSSDGLWIAQKFTASAGQTTTGYVQVTAAVTGSPALWTVTLEADNGSGAPSGTALAATQVPEQLVPSSAGQVTILLPATGLTPGGTYWIVAAAAGDVSDYYSWSKSNQTSGASTSTNGTTWTAQSYGLLFEVYDGTPALPLTGFYEDSGDRWTLYNYTSGELTGISEWTAGQTATGYAWSARTLSYSGGDLTGVA